VTATVYIEMSETAPIRRGDMIFQIAEFDGRTWGRRLFAHTGISEEDKPTFRHRDPIRAVHMGMVIESIIWPGGLSGRQLRVDVSGSIDELSDETRDRIIDTGRVYYEADPSVFELTDPSQKTLGTGSRRSCNPSASRHNDCCYWVGDLDPNHHPLGSETGGTYAFSCATFAHYCYEKVFGRLVVMEDIPFIHDDERRQLERDLSSFGFDTTVVQPTPFRRLYPSYLIWAFRDDCYPFTCENWDMRKDHAAFIPAHTSSRSLVG
jgi:hypothetical protein